MFFFFRCIKLDVNTLEMSMDLMLIHKDLTLIELMKRGIFIIKSICLSVKNDGQFIMYQTIGISLVHKSKYQTNQRYQEKKMVIIRILIIPCNNQ